MIEELEIGWGEEAPVVAVNFLSAANALSISERTLWSLVRDGQIRAFNIGRRRLISMDELRRFVAEKTKEAARQKT